MGGRTTASERFSNIPDCAPMDPFCCTRWSMSSKVSSWQQQTGDQRWLEALLRGAAPLRTSISIVT